MLFSNRSFRGCLALVVSQQVSLGISTYFIASAGRTLAARDIDQVLRDVLLFFAFALTAYLISSLAAVLGNRVQNELWQSYISRVFGEIGFEQGLGTQKNKEQTLAWLVGEAPSTLSDVSTFVLQAVSLYSNIIFTFFVFGLTLGVGLTGVISLSLIFSVFIVTRKKDQISDLSLGIQSKKLGAILRVNSLWDIQFNGNSQMREAANARQIGSLKEYFKETERYASVEQFLAAFPIVFSVPVLCAAIFWFYGPSGAELGILVAVLPRTLQLFGNVHSVSVLNSKLILMRTKYRRLLGFSSGLERRSLGEQIRADELKVLDHQSGVLVDISILMSGIGRGQLRSGRYTIRGGNGAGKSTLVKVIKDSIHDAVMVGPNIHLLESDFDGSSGELLLRQLHYVFKQKVPVLLLDEWDANLDSSNTERIDALIDELSQSTPVVEVRHRSM